MSFKSPHFQFKTEWCGLSDSSDFQCWRFYLLSSLQSFLFICRMCFWLLSHKITLPSKELLAHHTRVFLPNCHWAFRWNHQMIRCKETVSWPPFDRQCQWSKKKFRSQTISCIKYTSAWSNVRDFPTSSALLFESIVTKRKENLKGNWRCFFYSNTTRSIIFLSMYNKSRLFQYS